MKAVTLFCMAPATFFYVVSLLWGALAIWQVQLADRLTPALLLMVLFHLNFGFAVTIEVIERASKREH